MTFFKKAYSQKLLNGSKKFQKPKYEVRVLFSFLSNVLKLLINMYRFSILICLVDFNLIQRRNYFKSYNIKLKIYKIIRNIKKSFKLINKYIICNLKLKRIFFSI